MVKIKIVIFEPHPDDLLFGVGHKIFDWIKEGHEIHVITVTDGRACYRMLEKKPEEIWNITEEEVAKMRIQEAKDAIEYLEIPSKNHHLLYHHDADGQKYVEEAISEVKPIIKGADRIVLPSDNNNHVDHQATHDIAVNAAKELELKDAEYFVYFIPSYGKFNEDSTEKQFEVKISDQLRKKLLELLDIYQSQRYIKYTWKMYKRFFEKVEKRKFASFNYEDIGDYYNI